MNLQTLVCPMCGHEYEPARHTACSACPLQRGCQLACCPVCGYNTVNPGDSRLARWAARWLPGSRSGAGKPVDFEEHGSTQ